MTKLPTDDYMMANRRLWNEWTVSRPQSDYVDVESFRSGKSTLKAIELEEVGDVSGKSLLHLQCNIGLDTLSWARLGGQVTGVDFADKAIDMARALSIEQNIEARFVVSNVYDLPDRLEGRFDIVFTSWGVLGWLPDLKEWSDVVSDYVKPGGIFYIVDYHPFGLLFYHEDAEEDAEAELKPHYSYFQTSEPLIWDSGPGEYNWQHSVGDIINSLVSAGLRIEYLHEFPFSDYKLLPEMVQDEDGWWRLQGGHDLIPLVLSLRATK